MLIQRQDGMLVVVRQTDHMAQVARMAEVWGNARFPAPEHREETIRAAGLHDNGWRDWEEQPTLVPETGRPRNLGEVEIAVHAAFYRVGVERAVAIDPYTGLLVSMHATVLYAGVDGWDLHTLTPPARDDLSDVARAFIAEQVAVQRRLRRALATSPRYGASVAPARLWPAYLRLRAWDRLSLYFVYVGMGDGYLDHLPAADGETTSVLRQLGPRAATADPWPFDRAAVVFPVVAVRVPDRRYDDGAELLRVLAGAEPEVQEFTMRAPDRADDTTAATEDDVRALARAAGLTPSTDSAALAQALEADLRAMRKLRAVDAGAAYPAGVVPSSEARADGQR